MEIANECLTHVKAACLTLFATDHAFQDYLEGLVDSVAQAGLPTTADVLQYPLRLLSIRGN